MVNVRDAGCLDYPKFLLSALLLIFSSVCTFYAILEKKTSFWDVMPGWAALIIFLVILFWLGVMEGLQVGHQPRRLPVTDKALLSSTLLPMVRLPWWS